VAKSKKPPPETDPADDAIAEAAGAFDAIVADAAPAAEPPPGASAPAVPHVLSADWAPFLLAELLPHEVRNGDPTADGLMRLVEEWVGVVVQNTARVAQAPNAANGNHACVEHTLVVSHYDLPHLGPLRGLDGRYGGVADVFAGNGSRDAFSWRYSSATCETRAKARSCRAALRLPKAIAAEEKSELPDHESGLDGRANPNQLNALGLVCSRLDVSVAALLAATWKHVRPTDAPHTDLRRVPFAAAQRAQEQAQKWQQLPGGVPDSVRGYDPNWLATINHQGE
jgi:hypothetical protein